ncbi:hypothetical protein [Parabacteroides goldsteinii]|uniref:hypothetical protein n=1 Tax=Parabacteroides goldsteinii TaxID=328812 RepID=UPI003219AED2
MGKKSESGKIEKSMVADNGGFIYKSTNNGGDNITKIKLIYSAGGFLLGVLASIVGAFFYEYLKLLS